MTNEAVNTRDFHELRVIPQIVEAMKCIRKAQDSEWMTDEDWTALDQAWGILDAVRNR